MKKLIAAALVAIILTMTINMTGCNRDISLGTYSFKKVHIISNDGSGKCFEILSWRESEVGCEVKLKAGGSLWLSEGTYILVSDKCPLCESIQIEEGIEE